MQPLRFYVADTGHIVFEFQEFERLLNVVYDSGRADKADIDFNNINKIQNESRRIYDKNVYTTNDDSIGRIILEPENKDVIRNNP